jgi:hypothetical protein
MTRFLAVAVVVAWGMVAVQTWRLYTEKRAHEDAARAIEADELEAAGLSVEHQLHVADLERRVDDLTQGSADLLAALTAARRAAPRAHVSRVVEARTGPVVASIDQQSIAIDRRAIEQPIGACLLSPGDHAEIRVREVELRTDAGNTILVGAAEAWRMSPDARLFGGPFSAPLTRASVEPAPPPGVPSWVVYAAASGALVLGGLAGYGARAAVR